MPAFLSFLIARTASGVTSAACSKWVTIAILTPAPLVVFLKGPQRSPLVDPEGKRHNRARPDPYPLYVPDIRHLPISQSRYRCLASGVSPVIKTSVMLHARRSRRCAPDFLPDLSSLLTSIVLIPSSAGNTRRSAGTRYRLENEDFWVRRS